MSTARDQQNRPAAIRFSRPTPWPNNGRIQARAKNMTASRIRTNVMGDWYPAEPWVSLIDMGQVRK